jgi:hypothetical protein
MTLFAAVHQFARVPDQFGKVNAVSDQLEGKGQGEGSAGTAIGEGYFPKWCAYYLVL